jgi:hypothetical protein
VSAEEDQVAAAVRDAQRRVADPRRPGGRTREHVPTEQASPAVAELLRRCESASGGKCKLCEHLTKQPAGVAHWFAWQPDTFVCGRCVRKFIAEGITARGESVFGLATCDLCGRQCGDERTDVEIAWGPNIIHAAICDTCGVS